MSFCVCGGTVITSETGAAVNNIATQALVAAMADRKNIVDEQSARTAVSEITSD